MHSKKVKVVTRKETLKSLHCSGQIIKQSTCFDHKVFVSAFINTDRRCGLTCIVSRRHLYFFALPGLPSCWSPMCVCLFKWPDVQGKFECSSAPCSWTERKPDHLRCFLTSGTGTTDENEPSKITLAHLQFFCWSLRVRHWVWWQLWVAINHRFGGPFLLLSTRQSVLEEDTKPQIAPNGRAIGHQCVGVNELQKCGPFSSGAGKSLFSFKTFLQNSWFLFNEYFLFECLEQ